LFERGFEKVIFLSNQSSAKLLMDMVMLSRNIAEIGEKLNSEATVDILGLFGGNLVNDGCT
jgi:hypothetical protein